MAFLGHSGQEEINAWLIYAHFYVTPAPWC
jgi:hypothetical protein